MDLDQRLSRADCLRLLAGQSIGRVAFSERALPAVRPVAYALVGGQLVLWAREELAACLDGQVVAFVVDTWTRSGELSEGWSVLVTGPARLLRGPEDLVRAYGRPRTGEDRRLPDAAVRRTPGRVKGRRLTAGP